MKKIFKLILVCFVLVACSDDDDNSTNNVTENEGFLEVGDERFNLKSGTLENYGSYEASIFDFILNLYSSEFSSENELSFEDNVVSGVSMDLYVNSPFDLIETDYEKVSFDEISGNTYQALDVFISFDIENETGTTRQAVEGTFTVISTNPNYELEFTGVDNEGEVVSFYYKGTLVQIDSTDQ